MPFFMYQEITYSFVIVNTAVAVLGLFIFLPDNVPGDNLTFWSLLDLQLQSWGLFILLQDIPFLLCPRRKFNSLVTVSSELSRTYHFYCVPEDNNSLVIVRSEVAVLGLLIILPDMTFFLCTRR